MGGQDQTIVDTGTGFEPMNPFPASRLPAWITPVRAAFVGSLLLTWIAHHNKSINLDGILYVHSALEFLENGFDAAKAVYRFPFLPILMALVAKLTGLGPEHAGYLLNAVFMAGTCALLVSCVGRAWPEIAWLTCLAVLAIPGFNEYRHELLREYGCWFFSMLGFWLALHWEQNPRWMMAMAVQASLGIAALFRLEALAFFPALFLWQVWQAPRIERFRRLSMIGALPILVGIVLLALYFGGGISRGSKFAEELQHFGLSSFDAKAQALAASLIFFARGNAGTILFFGSLAVVPLKIIHKLGLFLVPLAFLFLSSQFRAVLARFAIFAWGIAACLFVLVVFVLDLQFLQGRYVGLVLLFSAPFVGVGLWLMMQRYPRWRGLILLPAVLMIVINLKALGPGREYYLEAGAWLSSNIKDSSRVYNENRRMRHYARWYKTNHVDKENRESIGNVLAERKYDYFVFDVAAKDPPIDPWLERNGLQAVKRFGRDDGEGIVVAVPARN
jgi:hypothetical protein